MLGALRLLYLWLKVKEHKVLIIFNFLGKRSLAVLEKCSHYVHAPLILINGVVSVLFLHVFCSKENCYPSMESEHS